MDRRWMIVLALVSSVLFTFGGCGDDSGDGNTAGMGGDGDGDGDGDSCELPNPQGSAANYISGLCGDCLCDRCPALVPQCDQTCYDLIVCMHQDCDGDVGDLDGCAAGACSAHAAGLSAAKAISSCLYNPADKDVPVGGMRNSCYISCNFGVR
jgi:hypothetical protein